MGHVINTAFTFETLHESLWQEVANLWQRKDKISGNFKNSSDNALFYYSTAMSN